MAEYCFCGCGQKVRFGKKRMSRLGAKAERTIETLKSVSFPLVEGDREREQVQALIQQGEEIRDLYAGLIHGTTAAPPVKFQPYVWEWERDAGNLAAAHLRDAQEAEESQASRELRAAEERGGKEGARRMFGRVVELYKQPVPREIALLHSLYLSSCREENGVDALHEEGWSEDELGALAASVARFGYAFRLYEEHEFEITDPDRVTELALSAGISAAFGRTGPPVDGRYATSCPWQGTQIQADTAALSERPSGRHIGPPL